MTTRRTLVFGAAITSLIFLFAFVRIWLIGEGTPDIEPAGNDVVESIAVLPFDSLKLAEDDQYLGLSLADSVVAKLSRNRNINVRPVGSIRHLLNRPYDPVEIGTELNVEAIVEATIERVDGLIDADVRIVRTSNGNTLWSGSFKESVEGKIALRDSIVNKIAAVLGFDVADTQGTTKPSRHSPAPRAYEAYLKGRYHWHLRSGGYFVGNTAEFFKEAVELDPDFALAHVGLAECYAVLGIYSFHEVDGIRELTIACAQKALSLDPDLSDAYRAIALVEFSYGWDWQRAEELYQLAIELNPRDDTARQWYGEMLAIQKRTDEAVVQLEKAAVLNPISKVICSLQGVPDLHAGNYELARAKFERAMEQHPNTVIPKIGKALCHEAQGEFEQALEIFGEYYGPGIESSASSIGVACCLAKLGKEEQAREIYDELTSLPFGKRFSPYGLAAICVSLGDEDKAFEWLNKAFDDRDDSMVTLAVDFRFKRLAGDPRFDELLRKMKLTSY